MSSKKRALIVTGSNDITIAYKLMTEDEFRFMCNLLQTGETVSLYSFFQTAYKYLISVGKKTGIKEFNKALAQFDILKQWFGSGIGSDGNRDAMCFSGLGGITEMSVHGSLLVKHFREACTPLRKAIKNFITQLNQCSDVAYPPNPNIKGRHYQIAVKISERLSKIWYVTKVSLFGSVAKGVETDESDIDIAIETLPQLKYDTRAGFRNFAYDIIEAAKSVLKNYEDAPKFNPIILTLASKQSREAFSLLRFFQSSVTLFERNDYFLPLKCMKIDSRNLIGYVSIKSTKTCYMFSIPEKEYEEEMYCMAFVMCDWDNIELAGFLTRSNDWRSFLYSPTIIEKINKNATVKDITYKGRIYLDEFRVLDGDKNKPILLKNR